MGDQPPSQQPPSPQPPDGPWPRAVPPYVAAAPPPPTGTPPPSSGRALVSRWTKGIAWLGVAATGVFSFVAARSLPGRSAIPTSGNAGGSQVGSTQDGQPSSDGSVLQPSSELPQASTRRPYLRSGGS